MRCTPKFLNKRRISKRIGVDGLLYIEDIDVHDLLKI